MPDGVSQAALLFGPVMTLSEISQPLLNQTVVQPPFYRPV